MSFSDLRLLISHLEKRGELARVSAAVDPNQEINIIQHKVGASKGPAILFENIKRSPYRVVSNLFGTKERVNLVFGGCPSELGNKLVRLFHMLMSPSIKSVFRGRHDILSLLRARVRNVRSGSVKEVIFERPNLESIPVLTCWPGDGGPFFTLPVVHTVDPKTGTGNLGIYRLQRFNHDTTGMHWQIEKGGGFHFSKAVAYGQKLPVSVILGGPPSLILAAVAPLPEGIDEKILAAYIMGKPLDVITSISSVHKVPAAAEFIIEGTVAPGDFREEGPFGDHFGHYSSVSDYPVFRINSMMARKDAIYPATVVGKPVQEDFYIGEALQEMIIPIVRTMRPAVIDLWSYPETGFHPLAVMSVNERYPKEALKHTLGILGEGQMSLTKVMITVNYDINVRDIYDVSRALWRYLDLKEGLHLLCPTQQDTLDFTGPKINTGSKLILIASDTASGYLRKAEPELYFSNQEIHKSITEVRAFGPSFLLIKVKDIFFNFESLKKSLCKHTVASKYLFHVLVSQDVPLDDRFMALWGWFTRFDPMLDLYPASKSIVGNKIMLESPILIDARWKKHYPKPVEFDYTIEAQVMQKWNTFGL